MGVTEVRVESSEWICDDCGFRYQNRSVVEAHRAVYHAGDGVDIYDGVRSVTVARFTDAASLQTVGGQWAGPGWYVIPHGFGGTIVDADDAMPVEAWYAACRRDADTYTAAATAVLPYRSRIYDRARAGDVITDDDVDAAVDWWHSCDCESDLPAFLGATDKEYKILVTYGFEAFIDAVAARAAMEPRGTPPPARPPGSDPAR